MDSSRVTKNCFERQRERGVVLKYVQLGTSTPFTPTHANLCAKVR